MLFAFPYEKERMQTLHQDFIKTLFWWCIDTDSTNFQMQMSYQKHYLTKPLSMR